MKHLQEAPKAVFDPYVVHHRRKPEEEDEKDKEADFDKDGSQPIIQRVKNRHETANCHQRNQYIPKSFSGRERKKDLHDLCRADQKYTDQKGEKIFSQNHRVSVDGKTVYKYVAVVFFFHRNQLKRDDQSKERGGRQQCINLYKPYKRCEKSIDIGGNTGLNVEGI